MNVATILPIPCMKLTEWDEYFMCLAHLLDDDKYMGFFREKSRRGDSVIMDNGVVETGLPMEASVLFELAEKVEATELILPDALNDSAKTLTLGAEAIGNWYGDVGLLAVPQGETLKEWRSCMLEMLSWPIMTIGISKFTAKFLPTRLEVLKAAPELIESKIDIHLLGCVSISNEIAEIEEAFPRRVKGVDSGIAAIAAQAGKALESVPRGQRVNVELDFFNPWLSAPLLDANIDFWKTMCLEGMK
jgi:hypothetical protein